MSKGNFIKRLAFFKGNNIKRFGFFLLAAFLFLMLTKLSETYTQSYTFEVELINLKEEFVLTSDSTQTLELVLSGKGFNMLPYSLYKPKTIYLDAQKDIYSNRKSFYWDAINNRHILDKTFGNSINVRSVKPDTLILKYDVLATKIVPVRFKPNITYALGYDVLGHFLLSQDSIKLVGSETILKNISEIDTKPITLDNVKNDINVFVELDNSGFTTIDIIPKKIRINGIVKRFTEGKLSVPIQILNSPEGKEINYFPKRVEVVYYIDLENFNSVKASDFIVTADFNDLSNSTQRFLELKVVKSPELVKTTRLSQNKIEYIISE